MYGPRVYSQPCGTKALWHVHKSPVTCTQKPCDTKAPRHVHKSLLYVCATHSMKTTLHETPSWQQSPSMKTCMLDWNWMATVQNSKACSVANTLMFIVHVVLSLGTALHVGSKSCLYEFTELNFLSVGSQLPPRTLNTY